MPGVALPLLGEVIDKSFQVLSKSLERQGKI